MILSTRNGVGPVIAGSDRPESASRVPLAAFLLGFLYVAGPVLAWTTSLSGEIVVVVLFGVAFVVALMRALRSEVHGPVYCVPAPFIGGLMIVAPSSWAAERR